MSLNTYLMKFQIPEECRVRLEEASAKTRVPRNVLARLGLERIIDEILGGRVEVSAKIDDIK